MSNNTLLTIQGDMQQHIPLFFFFKFVFVVNETYRNTDDTIINHT